MGQDADRRCVDLQRVSFAHWLRCVGGVMTAALALPNANRSARQHVGFMNGKQMTWLSALAPFLIHFTSN